MKKPNGHLNLLNLTFEFDNDNNQLIKTVLDENKNNITALELRFIHLEPELLTFLLHENTRFKFLETLTLNKNSVNLILENMLKKHAEQITHLQVVSHKSNISREQVPELPKLQILDLEDCDNEECVKSLCSKFRQSLTGISFGHCGLIDIEEAYFPQLKCLRLGAAENESDIISAHSDQLETLILEYFDEVLPDSLPKMKNLWLSKCEIEPNLLKSTPSLECLLLEGSIPAFNLKSTSKMPNLTDLYLLHFNGVWDAESKRNLLKESEDLFVNNADTLEFLVFKFLYNADYKSFQRISVQLKRVHTVIIYDENSLGIDRDILKAVCPNAQIMTTNNTREFAISIEAIKSRLKYLKADDLIFDDLYFRIKY